MEINDLDFSSDNLEDININAHIHRYGFSVNGHNILQDSDISFQYNKLEKLYKLPHSSSWFCGMVNQHNTLVPIYDLARLFNPEESLLNNKKGINMLTLDINGKTVGLLVDGEPKLIISEIKPISIDSKVVPELLASAHKATFSIDDNKWIEFSFHKLFLALSVQN